MPKIMYTPFKIGTAEIPNRLVASAMFEYGAVDGRITDKIKERYLALSDGGVGLIITGMQGVSPSASISPVMVNTRYDGYIEDMGAIVQGVHDRGGRIIVQLQHCGGKTSPAEGFDKFDVCEKRTDKYIYHEATKEELRKVAEDFAFSALRCKKAGADGIQIHAAHGFLINAFLSPSTNRRSDEYGGTIENRARLLFEIYDAVRNTVGKDFIVGVKFPFSDLNESSITPDETIFICAELEKKGIDFIEVSAGMTMDGSASSFTPVVRSGEEPPFLKYASCLADKINIPVISVCGYRSPETIEKALNETKISAVSFGRPLVREPDLPNRWKNDCRPALCVSCNRCCNSFEDGIITCQVKKEQRP